MQSRGLIDIDTMQNLKSLLAMSGPHYFVQGLVTVSSPEFELFFVIQCKI